MTGFVAFDDLCSHFKLFPQVLRALNPALLPTVLDGRKYVPTGYLLNLPAHHRSDDMVMAAVPAKALKPAQKPNPHYIVKRGDTAGKIAKMHGVKLADLITANNLDTRATIYARQTLRIPQYGKPIDTRQSVPALWREDTLFVRTEAAERKSSPDPTTETVPDEETLVRYRRPGPSPAELLMQADI
jgi:membrane-bound lytic murein transglycosylase D